MFTWMHYLQQSYGFLAYDDKRLAAQKHLHQLKENFDDYGSLFPLSITVYGYDFLLLGEVSYILMKSRSC